VPQADPRVSARTIIDVADLPARAGEALGTSSWHLVTQDEIDTFARLTGDEQWIHVDPERAKDGPFGTTIGHGYFTLSLSTVFLDEIVEVTGAALVLNYGSNRVRYPAPVPAGSQVRAAIDIAAVEPVPGGVQVVYRLTYELGDGNGTGTGKPPCVAEILYRYYTSVPGKGR
jgi:acyl dehydratase